MVECAGASRFQGQRPGQVRCRRQDLNRLGCAVVARPRFARSDLWPRPSRQGGPYRRRTAAGEFFGRGAASAKFGCDYNGGERKCAQLQGADPTEAQLQGADLGDAQLQGADLRYAKLQDANLRQAQLQGAGLSFAQLQGATLSEVGLQGADLRYAQLQGDDLNFTRLQGADLENAGLQGADLRYAELQGADLNGALVWRAKVPDKNAAKDVWGTPNAGAKSNGLECEYPREACDWSAASFAALRTLIIKEVPAGSDRDAALKRIAALEKPVDPADHSTADARGSVDQKLTFDQYFNALAVTLQHQRFAPPKAARTRFDGVVTAVPRSLHNPCPRPRQQCAVGDPAQDGQFAASGKARRKAFL